MTVPVTVVEGDLFHELGIDEDGSRDGSGAVRALEAQSGGAVPTVVALYLLPEAIATIRPAIDALLASGRTRVVCNTWGLPWREPTATAEAGDQGIPIFFYDGRG